MNKSTLILCITGVLAVIFSACQPSGSTLKNVQEMSPITENCISVTLDSMRTAYPDAGLLMERGVRQVAALWRSQDGSSQDFSSFCLSNFLAQADQKRAFFDKMSLVLEQCFGAYDQLSYELKLPVQVTGNQPGALDWAMSLYEPTTHFSDDMFETKVAFMVALNFPEYSLEEKNTAGSGWSRLEWAYARLGDIFTERVPASVSQTLSTAITRAENYIADYNIYMGHLVDADGRHLFPEEMCLLSHWNLRDELKSNYADVPNAKAKQDMIYKVMERITCQDIPKEVINNPKYDWNPYTNQVFCGGKETKATPEGTRRYQYILDMFHAFRLQDPFCPGMPTAIQRNFEGSVEVSDKEMESLFIQLLTSPAVPKVAKMIRERLGRDLEPYDIWYDGFKARTAMPEDKLSAQTRAKYPHTEAFRKDMPNLLVNLGFDRAKAEEISSRIVVDAARGSGHAWGAQGRGYKARLRTRIAPDGMDYKGYNIATHEFGHNVEQTLSLYDMDYYTLNGVPNTGFTETLAFIFQKRDLQLLGYPWAGVDQNTTLDIFWGCYEIMGVSLVDMYTWRWLYAHPRATAADLRDACLSIARDVWNRYFEPVLGTGDSPLLAIYSHMVNTPMYLPNYPYGHMIEYQLEAHLAPLGKADFAREIGRMYTLGRLTPQAWMRQAVGSPVSAQPMIDAVMAI